MAIQKIPIEQLKDGIAGAFRALSGDEKCEVDFTEFYESKPEDVSGKIPHYNKLSHHLSVPLPADFNENNLGILRGYLDSLALSAAFHNEDLHQENRAKSNYASLLDTLENVRVEALGASIYKGAGKNLAHKYTANIKANSFHTSHGAKTMPIQEAVAVIAFEYLTGIQLPAEAKEIRDVWQGTLISRTKQELDEMQGALSDQSAFSELVKQFAEKLNFGTDSGAQAPDNTEPETINEQEQKKDDGDQNKHENPLAKSVTGKQEEDDDSDASENKTDQEKSEEQNENDEASGRRGDSNIVPFPHFHPYAPYTRKFDEIISASDLVTQKELLQLRSQLDARLSMIKDITRRLAFRLQRKLLSQQLRSWKFHTEEGVLDPAKLTHIIIDPSYDFPYKYEKEINDPNTVVSLLIDNSGSMRGRPITVAALSADILVRTLERCGIKVEVLGFTTKEWKGGQSRKLWQANGSPVNPGRLNDLRHIIYKHADTPWRKARMSLGLMLKEGLLKENIDGEALLWAHERLLARPEKRKILMVISDGAPVDDSTLSANSAHFMEQHLKETIYSLEKYSDVELLAIGIGHDVNSYYQNAVTINNVEQLGDTMINKISELFSISSSPASGRGMHRLNKRKWV